MRPHTLSWVLIFVSVLAEVLGTIALRYVIGFTVLAPSLAAALCYAAAIWLMSLALQHLELGLTYAVWAGSGVALTAIVGVIWFDEAVTGLRVLGLVLIVGGVISLHIGAR